MGNYLNLYSLPTFRNIEQKVKVLYLILNSQYKKTSLVLLKLSCPYKGATFEIRLQGDGLDFKYYYIK